MKYTFEWDKHKNNLNIQKHGISFAVAQCVFYDKKRIIIEDMKHSSAEDRYYCIGSTNKGVITVRFTHRNETIRIFGAGYWRHGKKLYYEKNKIHKSS